MKIDDEFFDIDNTDFVKIDDISFMCNGKHIHYVSIKYESYRMKRAHVSEYTLLNKEKYIPIFSESQKLVIKLKYC